MARKELVDYTMVGKFGTLVTLAVYAVEDFNKMLYCVHLSIFLLSNHDE